MSFTDDLKGRIITLWKGGVEFNPPFLEDEIIDTEGKEAQADSPTDIKEDNGTPT